MFIGHFALGYAAKRWAPRVSLGALFGAAVFADLLWPILVALGLEQVRIVPGYTAATPLEFVSYPYSHSLLLLTVWGAVLGAITARIVGSEPRGGAPQASHDAPPRAPTAVFLVVLLLVVSHWVLDFITHVPDMPLYPGGPRYGLALWRSVPGTMAVEIVLFAIGVWMYTRVTIARDRTGRWVFVGLTAFLFIGFIANASPTPPPSVTALWIVALALGGLTIWLAWWADKHRTTRQLVAGRL